MMEVGEQERAPPTVTSLQAEAGGEGVDHNEADDVAAVVLDEAFELLDLLPEQVPLILLPFGIHIHMWCSDAKSGMSERAFYIVKADKNPGFAVLLIKVSLPAAHFFLLRTSCASIFLKLQRLTQRQAINLINI